MISNQDIQKNPINIYETTFSDAGFNNFTCAESFLQNNTGLKEIYNKYQVDIFEVNNFTTIYKSNLLLNYEGNSVYESAFPYLFKTLGYNVAITDNNKYGLPINFDNNNNGISIDTPEYISTLVGAKSSTYFNLSSIKTISGAGHNVGVTMPDNFTLTLWVNNETAYTYNNQTINITGNAYTNGVSVSYNGSFDGGAGGYYVNERSINSTVVLLRLTFFAKASCDGTGKVLFMGEPSNNIFTDNVYSGINFNVSNSYKKYTFSYTFPANEKYIDFRLYDYTNGTFSIKHVSSSTSYTIISKNSTLPFGNFLTLNNTLLKGTNGTAFIYMENSTVNNYRWIKFNFSRGLLIKNNATIAALIVLKNDTLSNNENKSYVVSIYPSSREYKVSYDNKLYSSIPGIYGNSIFTINKNITSLNNIKIITKGKIIMDVFYIGIIIYLTVLSSFLLDIYRKNKI